MSRTFDLPAFAAEIDQAGDMRDLWAVMVHFFRAAGFHGISYIVFSRGQPGEVSILLVDGFPRAITDAFMALGCGKNDPNYRYALATGRPSLRSRIAEITALSPDELDLMAKVKKLHHSDTLALPVLGPNNYVGIVALGLPAAHDTFEQASWTLLQMGALAAHLKGLTLHPAETVVAPHNLSPREVEILVWVAQGKSNSVIAEILSIATTTVDTYLRRIFEKLGVADRTSAAVKGVGMGLIRV